MAKEQCPLVAAHFLGMSTASALTVDMRQISASV